MADTSAPTAEGTQSQQQIGQEWQQQIAQAFQSTLAQLQKQLTQNLEQQLEPLRSRMRALAEEQVSGRVDNGTQQRGQAPRSTKADSEHNTATKDVARQEPEPEETEQQNQPDAFASDQAIAPKEQNEGEVAAPSEDQHEVPALQQWGESLEAVALMVLALGEVLEGVALLLQAIAYLRDNRTSEDEAEGETPDNEGVESGLSALKKLGEAASHSVSSLKGALTPTKNEGKSLQAEGDEEADGAEVEEEGEPSIFAKVSQAASHSVSSLKEALGHVTGDSSSEGGLAALQHWGKILEHASTLMQALGSLANSKKKGKSGLASLGTWWHIYRSAHSFVQELQKTFGNGTSRQPQRGGSGPVHKLESVLGSLTADNDDSPKHGLGGASSALQALAGGSSKEKSDGGNEQGGGLLDQLTGEDSPLQMLREFSKRQQGPGGLAPKGPMGRKPPGGPMRRDRIKGAAAGAR